MDDLVDKVKKGAESAERMAEGAEKIASKLKEEVTDELLEELKNTLSKSQHVNYSLFVFLFCVLVITSILAFVGYKLYMAQKERQRKAEEKQRLKQLKKKK